VTNSLADKSPAKLSAPKVLLAALAGTAVVANALVFLCFHLDLIDTAIWITVFQSSMISSVVGFAFAAIAGSILFQIDEHLHAVQIMLGASIALQTYSVIHLRKSIDFRAMLPFLSGGILVLPVGIYILAYVSPPLLLMATGVFLCIFGFYSLGGIVPPFKPVSISSDFIAGALGGILGPVTASPAFFVTIRCGSKGLDKTRQRGIYQPYILIMQIATLAALLLVGGSALPKSLDLLQYVPPALAGAYVGVKLFERLNDRQFFAVVAGFLIFSGCGLIAKAFVS
jgi:uncharacterized membrane protein YfcA